MKLKINQKNSILFLLALFFSLTINGRSPAVEPVSGISIDQYQEADPKKDPGYNWKHNSNQLIKLKNQRTPANTNYNSTVSTTLAVIFFLTITAFPIALWFTLMKAFPTTPNTPEQNNHHAETIDLAAERSRRELNTVNNDDDINKAS
jgi:hypothetical protein